MSLEKMDIFGSVGSKKSKEKIKPALGIDLGTTNSCIAVVRESNIPEVIGARKTMPSCVMWNGKFGDEKKFIVGEEAYKNRYKANVAYSTKKLMGSDEVVTLSYGGKTLEMKPEEVAAEVLKELVNRARVDYPGIEDVVITVPAKFSSEQVKATVKAGELAGLNVIKISREPTVSSLVYNLDKNAKGEEYVLVFDLGGGTFDVSLVRITKEVEDDTKDLLKNVYGLDLGETGKKDTKSVISVIKTDGDVHLGGDDLDLEIYKMKEKQLKDAGVDVRFIPREEKEKLILSIANFKPLADKAFKDLEIDFKLNDKNGTKVKMPLIISPSDYKKATKIIYKRCKKYVDAIMKNCDLINIQHIVLVGGSTKNEFLKEMLKQDFPNVTFNDALNPDETVALGAAVDAKRVKFKDDYLQVFDVTPNAIGILSGGAIEKMINKNQVVPFNKTRFFTTSRDNQEKVIVPVYEGNSPIPEECDRLGALVIDNLPKKPAGKLIVGVTLSVDADGLLSCFVKVDGKVTKGQIVNIFAADNQTKQSKNKVDKRLVRWQRLVDKLEDKEKKSHLSSLITGYQDGTISAKEVGDYVAELRGSLDGSENAVDVGISKESLMTAATGYAIN